MINEDTDCQQTLCRTPPCAVFSFDKKQLYSMAFQPVLQPPNENLLLMGFLYLEYQNITGENQKLY